MKKTLQGIFILIFIVGIHAIAYCQNEITVTGNVTSADDGSPLPGVSISVKGTTAGTTTDVNGKYQIQTPSNGTLVFSFIGMNTQEVAVNGRSAINIPMISDVKALNEVVVTALGVERETKSLGFSVTQVNNEDLTVARTTNVVNALSGKVAGVRIAGSNGMVGSSSAIFIRGFTTFTGNNQPLFVVDGIPINNGGGGNATQTGVSTSNRAIDLNQDDIESVSVLKGPAAAVLYGSRAAAGAVIITTKKGKAGVNRKNTVSYTGSYNIAEVNRFPDYQNEYAQGTSLTSASVPTTPVFQPNADQSNWGPRITGQTVPSAYSAADRALFSLPAEVALTAYPNNVRDVFRRGGNMQHTVAFQGAADKTNYYFSYSFLNETGVLENNKLTKHTFTGNASHQLTTKLNVGTNFTYVNNTSNRSQIGNQLSNPFFRGWFTPRNVDLKNAPVQRPDGTQVFFNNNTDNPFWTLRNNLYGDQVNRIVGNVNLSYDITNWLNVNYKIGTDAYTLKAKTVDAIGARGQANHAVQGVGAIGDRTIYNQETSSYLNLRASRKITQDIGATLLVGNEINIRTNTDELLVGNTLATREYNNMRNATNFVPLNDITRRRLVGIYADLQLNYKEWAFLGITGRNDWSSTFNPDKRSYFYPSVTGSLVISDMIPALQNNTVLSFAKLRANYARVGREAEVYQTDTYYKASNPLDGFGPQIVFPFLGSQGRTLSDTLGNPLLGPEFTRSWEIGTDVRLFNNRIGIDLGYFNTLSTDIILNVPVSGASGFITQIRNAGRLESTGIELALDITPIKTPNFTWTISANWTRIRNKVISLASGVKNVTLGGFTTAQSRVEAGQPYGVLYANVLLRNEQGRLILNDLGLPIADASGVKKVGDPNPDWLAGITNTISWKGITATFLIDIRQGGDILSRNIGDLRRTGVAAETAEFDRFDASGNPTRPYVISGVRQSDGQENTTPVSVQQYWSNLYNFSSPGEFVFDGSWVRLREASIFYSLPQGLLSRSPFGKVEIGLNGRNLLLFTKVPHIDPEVNLTGASNSQGLEFNSLPQTRTYGAVLRLTF